MTTNIALLLNAVLAVGVVVGLAAVVRLAFRLHHAERTETLHPSQPIPLHVVAAHDARRELARAA
jgi:hypothetical protein